MSAGRGAAGYDSGAVNPGQYPRHVAPDGLLERKAVSPDEIAPVCRFLIKNMAFFFVPPGVALMLYFDVIAREWLPITVATVVSIFLVIVVTGRLHQFIHGRIKRHSNH